MFTLNQNNELNRIIAERPSSIRDLALLSLAYKQNHPKLLEWRRFAPKTYHFPAFMGLNIQSLNLEPEPANILEKMPFFVEPIEPEKNFMWHIGDCYYIGFGDGPGLYTTSLRTLLKVAEDVESVCTECLDQVSRVLRHLYDKDISYVHGNLTIDSVVQSLDGRFYIVDNGIQKQNTSPNPFECYTSLTHDMTTLCDSIRTFVNPETYVGKIMDTAESSYESFLKHLSDKLKVFKSNNTDDK